MIYHPDDWETHPTTFDDIREASEVHDEYLKNPAIVAVNLRHLDHPSKQAGFEIIFIRKSTLEARYAREEKEDTL